MTEPEKPAPAPALRSPGWLGKLRTFDSFKIPAFRFYFFGMVGQWSGTNMQMITNSLLAYRITGSAAILGVVALASALPTLLLSLIGGVVADRMQKKHLLQFGQAVSALVALIIGIAISVGYMGLAHPESWWILLVTSIFTGIAAAFSMPARQSIIPELVGRGELMNAVSLNTMGLNIFRLVSPAVAGFLIDAVNFAAVYYVICGLFLLGVIFTALLPRTSAAHGRRGSPLNDITEGLKYIRSRPSIFFLLSFGFTFVVMFIPFQNLLPVFSDSILKVGATGLGILMSVSGAGALAASIVLASFPPRRRGLLHLSFTLILSAALIIFSFTHVWWLSLVLMAFIGMGQTVHVTTGTTLIQSLAEPQYMGRVMSIFIMNFGLSGLGTFLAGILAQGIGIQWAIGGFGLALAAVSLAALLFVPRIRQLD